MPVVSLENRQGSGIVSIVSNQSASSSASQTQSSSLSQMQGEPIGSSVNAQTVRALSPLEPPARPTPTEPLLFPPSTTSFPAIFRDPVRQQTSQQTIPTSTPLAMPAIPNYRENRVVPVTQPPTTHHSRSSSFPSITTFTSLAASRALAIQASVTTPERIPTPQSRQEQSTGDSMVIDSSDNGAIPATNQQVFKQGEKRTIPPKATVSPQSQHRDKRRMNEEFVTARSRSGSQVDQQPATAAAAESPKVASEPSTAPETSTTAASIDKLHTEISALAEAMKNLSAIMCDNPTDCPA